MTVTLVEADDFVSETAEIPALSITVGAQCQIAGGIAVCTDDGFNGPTSTTFVRTVSAVLVPVPTVPGVTATMPTQSTIPPKLPPSLSNTQKTGAVSPTSTSKNAALSLTACHASLLLSLPLLLALYLFA